LFLELAGGVLGGSQREGALYGNTARVCLSWRFTWIAAQLEASPVDMLNVGLIWLDCLVPFVVAVLTTHSAAWLVWAVLVEVA